MPPTSSQSRFAALDGIRGLAMVSVFVFHFGLPSAALLNLGGGEGAKIIPNLNLGVEVFFVLSGFLIYRPYAVAHATGAPRPPLLDYSLRRALRIYPAYWFALAVLLLNEEIYLNGFANGVKHGTLTFAYFRDFGRIGDRVPGIDVAWTLVVEVSFYAFVPVYAWVLRRVRARNATLFVVPIVLAGIGFGVRWYINYNGFATWPWVAVLPQGMAALAPGMLLAVATAVPDVANRAVALGRRTWLWWAAAALAFFVLTRYAAGSPVYSIVATVPSKWIWHVMLAPVVGALLVAPLVLAPRERGAIRVGLALGPVAWLGTVSYGAYLWHRALILNHLDAAAVSTTNLFTALAMLIGTFGLTLVVAAFSWYVIERPALGLAPRIARRGRGLHSGRAS